MAVGAALVADVSFGHLPHGETLSAECVGQLRNRGRRIRQLLTKESLVDGASPLSLRVQGADVPDTIPITLEGGEIKLVLVLAHEPTIRRDYLAMDQDSGVLVRCSSGRIVATQSDDSGFALDVDAVPDRRTVTRVVVPDGMKISVEGAKTSSVEPQGRWQTVTVVHSERPARIRVSRE